MTTEKQTKKPKERYLKIPYHILNIGGLGLNEKVLLAYIYGFGEAGCWQSNAVIAKVFSTNTRTVRRWIKRIHKYITIKCPHGYYRTLWANSHPDVREGQKKWVQAEQLRKARSRHKTSTVVGQNRPTKVDRIGQVSRTNQAVERGQNCPTINNHIKKEITEETTAPPSPSPAVGAVSAVLEDRKVSAMKDIEKFKKTFGRKEYTPLTEQQFAKKRDAQLRALRALPEK